MTCWCESFLMSSRVGTYVVYKFSQTDFEHNSEMKLLIWRRERLFYFPNLSYLSTWGLVSVLHRSPGPFLSLSIFQSLRTSQGTKQEPEDEVSAWRVCLGTLRNGPRLSRGSVGDHHPLAGRCLGRGGLWSAEEWLTAEEWPHCFLLLLLLFLFCFFKKEGLDDTVWPWQARFDQASLSVA